jgi:predicted transcriptional regulator
MTTQIAVRLPDPLVEALDAIAAGTATRSEIVRLALEQFVQREERRKIDEALTRGYAEHPPGGEDEWGDLDAQTDAEGRAAGRALDEWDGGW